MKQIQGLMFVRDMGKKTVLVAIIDSKPELKTESQYEFIGNVKPDGTFNIQTTGNVIDISDISKGNTPDGLLTEPIWRN